MDAREFDRDVVAWIHGGLPPARAAEMQAAADASPEFARRAQDEREFDARVKRALMSDAAGVESVRAMIARARTERRPEGKLLFLRGGALRAMAAAIVLGTFGAWWFCVPPFDCAYMQALESASQSHAAVPGPDADAAAARLRLPDELDGAKAARPVASTPLDFFAWHLQGVRLDYVRPDGSAFHVEACDSKGVRPSRRRRVDRDGASWWTRDRGGRCTWAFDTDGSDVVYAVVGDERDDESLFAAAKALRAAVR